MIKVGTIEKKIKKIEEVDVEFLENGVNVRSDKRIDADNYKYERKLKNSATVSQLKKRLRKQYPGYDFVVKDVDGNAEKGNKQIGKVRDTYLEDDE